MKPVDAAIALLIGELPVHCQGGARRCGLQRCGAHSDVRRLGFIRRARELGLPLNDVRALLELGADSNACAEVKEVTDRHIADIRRKISDLRRLEGTLRTWRRAAAQTAGLAARCSKSCGPSTGPIPPRTTLAKRSREERTISESE